MAARVLGISTSALVLLLACAHAGATIVRVDFSGTVSSGFFGTTATGFIQYDTTLASDGAPAATEGFYAGVVTGLMVEIDGTYTVGFAGGGTNRIRVFDTGAGDVMEFVSAATGVPTPIGSHTPTDMKTLLGGEASVLSSDALPTDFSPVTRDNEMQIGFDGGAQRLSIELGSTRFSVVDTPAPATLPLLAIALVLAGTVGRRGRTHSAHAQL